MPSLRTFDAFPKTGSEHVQKSSKGGVSSILTYFFLLFIAWSEFGSYFGGYIDTQYTVDDRVQGTAQINLDMFVKMPCKWVGVIALDQTGDKNIVSEDLSFEDMPFFIPFNTKMNGKNDIVTPGLDEILSEAIPAQFRERIDTSQLESGQEFDGCHIFGSIPVNAVRGELRIVPKGFFGLGLQKPPLDEIDFSHVFNEFSFGDFYPYIDNPLDQTGRLVSEHLTSINYYASVVPTTYKKMGAIIRTNQYSLSETAHAVSLRSRKAPGISIFYNFEALTIVVSDERITFLQFVVRLVAMLSFFVYIASWIFRCADTVLVLGLGPKWSLRYQGHHQKVGILEKNNSKSI
ncbi:LAMI_0H01178g1_1 [Lachancea mirantina]|uniref:Endoplasmic reticulum-Golgi intermediate compartment protein n=1 Tax=Lachancea mirantina TaxID=1230905 RepID=A0A1G4KE07_9SACH|nr:LAMI_0H01178g1_1 [Lachancea mirantina]